MRASSTRQDHSSATPRFWSASTPVLGADALARPQAVLRVPPRPCAGPRARSRVRPRHRASRRRGAPRGTARSPPYAPAKPHRWSAGRGRCTRRSRRARPARGRQSRHEREFWNRHRDVARKSAQQLDTVCERRSATGGGGCRESLEASVQSRAACACRTASTTYPCSSYHSAAALCAGRHRRRRDAPELELEEVRRGWW